MTESSAPPAPSRKVRVTKIEAHGWRGLDLSIDLSQSTPITCFTGANGSGKSSLLALVRWGLGSLWISGASTGERSGGVPGFTSNGTRAVELQLNSEAMASSIDRRIQGMYDEHPWAMRQRLHQAVSEGWEGRVRVSFANGDPDSTVAALGEFSAEDGVVIGEAIRHALTSNERWGGSTPRYDVPAFLHIGSDRAIASAITNMDLGTARLDFPRGSIEQVLHYWIRKQVEPGRQNLLQWKDNVVEHAKCGELLPYPGNRASFDLDVGALLPDLRPEYIDVESGQLWFNHRGRSIPFDGLSSGQQDVVLLTVFLTLVGTNNAVILFDEPELHIHPQLVRDRLRSLVKAVGDNQLFIATHSYEAIEAAGESQTYVLQPSDQQGLVTAVRWNQDVAARTIAGALGWPSLTMAGHRFVFVEGKDLPDNRRRFHLWTGEDDRNCFIPVGSCEVVKARLPHVASFAAQGDYRRTLIIGGIIDRDYMSDDEAQAIEVAHKGLLHVLGCHEEENLYLFPEVLQAYLDNHTHKVESAEDVIRQCGNSVAGKWIVGHAKAQVSESISGKISEKGVYNHRNDRWTTIDAAPDRWVDHVLSNQTVEASEASLLSEALYVAISEFRDVFEGTELWRLGNGKEMFNQLPRQIQLNRADPYVGWITMQWGNGNLPLPPPIRALRAWLDSLQPPTTDSTA